MVVPRRGKHTVVLRRREVVPVLVLLSACLLLAVFLWGRTSTGDRVGCGAQQVSSVLARLLVQSFAPLAAAGASDPSAQQEWSSGPGPSRGAISIRVDVTRRQLFLLSNGILLKKYPIAVGKESTPTPIGHWRIKEKDVWGEGFGARWLGLDVPWGSYGIHGTNKPWTVGSDESGGCMRMFNSDVIELFGMVEVGTPVTIVGRPFYRYGQVRRVVRQPFIGADVAQVQAKLKRMGFYDGKVDGKFGYKTEEAVVRLQEAMGLPETGAVDAESYDLLGIYPAAEDPTLRPE